MIAFVLASKNVTRKRERSILTIIGVLLAVASTISLISIAEGLYTKVNYEINLQNVDLYILPKSTAFLPAGSIGAVGGSSFGIPYKEVENINNIPGVEVVMGITRILANFKKDTGVLVWGVEPEKMAVFFPYFRIVQGRYLATLSSGELIGGNKVVKELSLSLGEAINISNKDFVLVGTLAPVDTFEDYAFFSSLKDVMDIQQTAGVQEIWVKVTQEYRNNIEAVKQAFQQAVPTCIVKTKQEYLGEANHFVNLIRLLQYAISAIGIMIAITAAMNTMLMSTYERMKEFGTLRAIGASKYVIFEMVLFESLFLSLIGGSLGVLLGFLGASLFNEALTSLFKISVPVTCINLKLIVEAILLSVGIGVVGAIIPAVIASRIDIIKTLRWE